MFNKMVGNLTMKVKTNCYIKIAAEDYYCDKYECKFPQIHLIFLSKQDYKKISDIEKMVKRYYKIEKKYLGTEKKYIIYYYLKEMIKQLEEHEVVEVYSDHVDAFHLEFSYISDFIFNVNMDLKLPQQLMIVYDEKEEYIEKVKEYYEDIYGSENVRYLKKIKKVIRLLKQKILFQ